MQEKKKRLQMPKSWVQNSGSFNKVSWVTGNAIEKAAFVLKKKKNKNIK